MKVQIVDTDGGFDALESSWNLLTENRPSSFFSTFDYVRTAWKHFHRPTDRLFLLVLGDGPSVEGIAPFYIRSQRKRGIPIRRIRFISTWEGDRPRILATGSEEAAWRDIMAFLEREFRDWEVLELTEQPVEGPEGSGWSFLFRSGWHWERSPGAVDYYVSLGGSWEDYLKSLDSHTRHDWRRRSRRLSSTPGGYAVEWISDPVRIREALSRFVTLERSGWKADAGIGVARDEGHRAFYEDLLLRLAMKGQALIGFLKSGAEDMASEMIFLQQDVIFARHTTYSKDHAVHSPGILLNAEIIRYGFGGPYRECDFLSMKGNKSPKSKSDWANGRRELVDWTGYRIRSRFLPLIAAKRLKRLFGKDTAQAAEGG
jgi:CelD/BcsL family acetyltransferase involved in cellulose biosynthesis